MGLASIRRLLELPTQIDITSLPGNGVHFQVAPQGTKMAQFSLPAEGSCVQPRGLSPEAHIEEALQATHPLSTLPTISRGFAKAAKAMQALGPDAMKETWLKRLAMLKELRRELAPRQEAVVTAAQQKG